MFEALRTTASLAICQKPLFAQISLLHFRVQRVPEHVLKASRSLFDVFWGTLNAWKRPSNKNKRRERWRPAQKCAGKRRRFPGSRVGPEADRVRARHPQLLEVSLMEAAYPCVWTRMGYCLELTACMAHPVNSPYRPKGSIEWARPLAKWRETDGRSLSNWKSMTMYIRTWNVHFFVDLHSLLANINNMKDVFLTEYGKILKIQSHFLLPSRILIFSSYSPTTESWRCKTVENLVFFLI